MDLRGFCFVGFGGVVFDPCGYVESVYNESEVSRNENEKRTYAGSTIASLFCNPSLMNLI